MTYDELKARLRAAAAELGFDDVRRIELNHDDTGVIRAHWLRIENALGRTSPDETEQRIDLFGKIVPVSLDCPETCCVIWDDEELLNVLSAQLWTP